mmetsp:Transcript_2264/g.6874  ORF Transcript_2264/g.6874 Transcript_2264/m.6874 type:complete len:83 (-) Transcript_2264:125-373(-)
MFLSSTDSLNLVHSQRLIVNTKTLPAISSGRIFFARELDEALDLLLELPWTESILIPMASGSGRRPVLRSHSEARDGGKAFL